MSADPISERLADAFGRMILGYDARDWTPDDPDTPRVSLDHTSYDYKCLCNLVESFDDKLPEDLLIVLWENIHHRDEDLKLDLETRKSYSSAARTLQLLMERRIGAYRKREEVRKTRE